MTLNYKELNPVIVELANVTEDNIKKGVTSTLLKLTPAFIMPDKTIYYMTTDHYSANFYEELEMSLNIIGKKQSLSLEKIGVKEHLILWKNNFLSDYQKFFNNDISAGDVRKLLTDQVHELALRMPNLFDENGEEEDWYKLGDNCLAYLHNDTIISVLTYTIEKDNIHIYLTYTVPVFRSSGYGSILIEYMKFFAMKNNIKTITVCTDVSKNNRVPNMLNKNKFVYFKTGYEKIIRR